MTKAASARRRMEVATVGGEEAKEEEEDEEAVEEQEDGDEEEDDGGGGGGRGRRGSGGAAGEDEKEAAELRLATELAAFLRARHHPKGLALGALAGSEVRQALRDPLRDAGVRTFKAKWLSRFPAELLFDGKMVRAAPTFSAPPPRPGGQERYQAALASPIPRRSCLRRCTDLGTAAVGAVAVAGDKAWPRRATFSGLIEVLCFKLGHEPGAVAKRGQHVQRPLASEDDEATVDGNSRGDPSAAPRKRGAKFAKEAWLDPTLLPPIDAGEEAMETIADGTASDLEDVVVELVHVDGVGRSAKRDDDEDDEWTKV